MPARRLSSPAWRRRPFHLALASRLRARFKQSLKRLAIDHIDLLQHHEIIRFDEADRIFAEDGAMDAFIEARKEGKTRYIGFTGHKDPRVHLYMLSKAKGVPRP